MKNDITQSINYIFCGANLGLLIFNLIRLISTGDMSIVLVILVNILGLVTMVECIIRHDKYNKKNRD